MDRSDYDQHAEPVGVMALRAARGIHSVGRSRLAAPLPARADSEHGGGRRARRSPRSSSFEAPGADAGLTDLRRGYSCRIFRFDTGRQSSGTCLRRAGPPALRPGESLWRPGLPAPKPGRLRDAQPGSSDPSHTGRQPMSTDADRQNSCSETFEQHGYQEGDGRVGLYAGFCVRRSRDRRAAAIHLGLPLPAGSCGLPAGSGEQPSIACAGHRLAAAALLGLAPGGVYRATPVARGAGELLPHRFTLTGT